MHTPEGLKFDPGSHTYTLDGQPLPSVTSVLEPFSGLRFVDPQVLEAAALFGTHVHEAVDLYNRGELDEAWLIEESPLVHAHLEGWKRFLSESAAVVVASEQKVCHPKLQYAGTLDSILNVSKTNRLYDIKTGASVPETVGPQCAAYNRAYREMTGERLMKCYCVHLEPNKYTVHPLNDPRDWDVFKAALTLHRWTNST